MRYFLLLALMITKYTLAQNSLEYQSVWKCDEAKFNWYCDEENQPKKIRKQETISVLVTRLEPNQIKTAQQWRAELKRREDVMVMNPTERNIKDYLTIWQLTQEKGALLADNWRRVVWQNPEFDYSLKRPANNSAIKLYDDQHLETQDKTLRALSKEHGLIFFFRSDCQYCHAMAPTLKMLSKQYGIEVLGVSIDGKGLPDFPNPKDGRAQAAKWGVERVPALFIGAKKTGDKAPIGFGMMALSEIINRIFVLTDTQAGQNF
jgi:conjugal transfer pilus assembly protein TraF